MSEAIYVFHDDDPVIEPWGISAVVRIVINFDFSIFQYKAPSRRINSISNIDFHQYKLLLYTLLY